MGIKIHGRYLPPLFCVAIGAAITLLLAAALWWYQGAKAHQHWSAIYGENLASMAAKSAIDATLNHDLVSLQVVLQDVAQSPYVIFATIHDVENNLLVQSGDAVSPHQMASVLSYSAPIGFQQNVAGYITVHMRAPLVGGLIVTILIIVSGLLCIVAVMSIWEVRESVFEYEPNSKKIPEEPDDDWQEEGDVSALDEDPAADAFVVRATAQAVLEIHDYSRLMQTLSADLACQIKHQLCETAELALSLYGGQWARAPELASQDGALVALFPSAQSEDDALRTAAFFSAVVKAAFVPACVKASVDSMIGLQDEFNDLTSRPASPFAMYFSSDEHRQALARRLNMVPLDGHWWQLESFDIAYQKLLDKQVEQLLLK
ncbi:hypothetical protein [Marinagarivorans cellulosilyticus]|uniref:Uncharacterized protein n=1 Tax=Marinagarivorans cellulosilyticus TaxID=2721545 RepID=A0AAN2BKQ2_9GAMM|nr:hypothetical protein [Marinagarivorans cellulosilyticus]BCD98251.1 hypothetical protein MARGE09_P2452 [Marinagarivorans cellulosilyticus]